MKAVAIRFPEEMHEWLRRKAASETIKRNARVSMNSYVLELVTRDMEADARKEKIKSLTGNQCQGYG